MPNKVPLTEVYAEVQRAVAQVVAKYPGVGPVEKLWVGFVSPEAVKNEMEVAREVASHIGHGAGVTPSAGQLSAAPGGTAGAKPAIGPHHILGLIFDPNAAKKV